MNANRSALKITSPLGLIPYHRNYLNTVAVEMMDQEFGIFILRFRMIIFQIHCQNYIEVFSKNFSFL